MAKKIIPSLTVLMGPRQGKRFPLKKDSYIVGAGKTAAIRLPGEFVSDEHLVVRMRGDETWVIENRSEHGTLVNTQRVETRVLQDEDKIQMGTGIVLMFSLEQPSAEAVEASAQEKTSALGNISPKSLLIGGGLAFYLVGILGFYLIYMAPSFEPQMAGLTASVIEERVTETMAMIDAGVLTLNEQTAIKHTGPAYPYYLAISSHSDPSGSEAARDAFAERVRGALYDVLRSLQAGHKRVAIQQLDELYALAPDIRLPVTALALSTRSQLRDDNGK